MVTALDNRKQQLIQDILKLERADDLSIIEAQVKAIQTEKNHSNGAMHDLEFYIGNIEEKVDVEKIVKEQGVQKLDMEKLNAMIEAADFQEDIDDLLLALK